MIRFERSLSEKVMMIKNKALELNTSKAVNESRDKGQSINSSVDPNIEFSMTMLEPEEEDEEDDD